jgi:hypothetical protein
LLEQRLDPCASGQTRILTDQAIKVANAVRCPASRWPACYCARGFRHQKRALYFAAGAREVWICDRNNTSSFYSPDILLERSKLCPDFPFPTRTWATQTWSLIWPWNRVKDQLPPLINKRAFQSQRHKQLTTPLN